MSDKYQDKYRTQSARLQSWDYGSNAAYFITICTAGREHYFGEIILAQMQLSETGKIAEQEWIKTPDIRPDMKLELDVFVVMPNHFHAIICIGKNEYNSGVVPPISQTKQTGQNKFGPQSKNLASIIRGYKSAVTTYARKNNITFGWQPRFHDHIIRNKNEFDSIRNYIINNPSNWKTDNFFNP